MKEQKHYAERNARALGKYYTAHVSAMTREKLFTKSDIAAELAHRDKTIDDLKEKTKWHPIETAPDGEKKVRVGWYSNGAWVESVDVKLDGVWLGHGDEYNHYHTTSEEAPPYKYWMEYTQPPKE